MPFEQDQNHEMTYDLTWDAEQALHPCSSMDDAMLLGLLEDDVPMDLIAETMLLSRAALAERVLVLIEEGFLGVEVLI